MNPPVLASEQREHARMMALRARRERADLRASLRKGAVSITQALESDHEAHRRMRVRDLLSSLPGIGPIRSAQIMDLAGIASTKRVGGLTQLQRDRLIQVMVVRSLGGVE